MFHLVVDSLIDVATYLKLVLASVQLRFAAIAGTDPSTRQQQEKRFESSNDSRRMIAAGGVENP